MTATFAFAFLAGGVATANPCGFGLLLAYVARQLGVDADPGRTAAASGRALAMGAATTGGFVAVFAVVGTAISLTGSWLIGVVPWAALVAGLVLMATGALVAAGRHVGPRSARRVVVAASSYRSALLFGALYGVCSIACTLPIFLVVAALAVTAGPVGGVATFSAYALGMGTVLTALAVAVALAREGLARAIRRVLPYLVRLSGVLLMLAGAYVVYYWAFALGGVSSGGPWAAPLDWVSQFSSRTQTWLASGSGWRLTSWLFAALAGTGAGLAIWRLLARWSPAPPPSGSTSPKASDPAVKVRQSAGHTEGSDEAGVIPTTGRLSARGYRGDGR